MPKKKTVKAAAKRLKKTASGKLKYHKSGAGHLQGGKSRKRKRGLRKATIASAADQKRLSPLI